MFLKFFLIIKTTLTGLLIMTLAGGLNLINTTNLDIQKLIYQGPALPSIY